MASSEPRWHPEAAVDAEDARNWYAERSSLAARGFLLKLEHAIRLVTEAPERWARTRHHCRRYVFPTYPFSLVFRLVDEGVVEIVAVAHQQRRPGFWTRRPPR